MGPTCHPCIRMATSFPGLGVITVSLSVFQNIMGFVRLIYPTCRQHYPDSHMGLRSKRRRCLATRVGLIKFIHTNKGMTYPIIQPDEQASASQRLPENTQTQSSWHAPLQLQSLWQPRLSAGDWEGSGNMGLMGCVGFLCP